ncbi:ABC transporter permease [Granulicatella seriolae]|uniref:ABC transporter permease n=1 Tax=Granulicatella seriolae TaxID=2967226 RepID=A0ABT1WLX4_9LACT|nr:ABC transporter permease [Granulicatella seriolae]
MDLIVSSISQGILWGILSLGIFISFRVLNIADMTTEGTYPLGAATCVMLIQQGVHPLVATLAALITGGLAGLVTGLLITVCKIPSLLAGILTMTGLLSINLRIMGRPNLNLADKATIFDGLNGLHLPPYFDIIFMGIFIVALIILLMYVFFSTEIGQALIATGDNPLMAASLGISTKSMTVFGLILSNSLVALTGAILSQNNGYADVNSGLGTIVIALAAIIIGEVIFGDVSFFLRLICIIFGSIIYRLLLMLVLQIPFIQTNDFKLLSAILIAACLTIPQAKSWLDRISKRQVRGGRSL